MSDNRKNVNNKNFNSSNSDKNIITKNKNIIIKNSVRECSPAEEKTELSYGYYSKLLQRPFDSLNELQAAELAYQTKQKAKETAASQKKTDAAKVEAAFKTMNQARKMYKQDMQILTANYCEDLRKIQKSLEEEQTKVKAYLREAEENYEKALKEFTEKYQEGFHITLKDGDAETTVSRGSTASGDVDEKAISAIFDLLFGNL